jgi:hypothetical protein
MFIASRELHQALARAGGRHDGCPRLGAGGSPLETGDLMGLGGGRSIDEPVYQGTAAASRASMPRIPTAARTWPRPKLFATAWLGSAAP